MVASRAKKESTQSGGDTIGDAICFSFFIFFGFPVWFLGGDNL